MKEEREEERWVEIIRSKLADVEGEPTPNDWELIARRLPAGRKVGNYLFKRWQYAVAAAACLLLFTIGGLYTYHKHDTPLLTDVTPLERPENPLHQRSKQQEENRGTIQKSIRLSDQAQSPPSKSDPMRAQESSSSVIESRSNRPLEKRMKMLDAASPILVNESNNGLSESVLKAISDEMNERRGLVAGRHKGMADDQLITTTLLADAALLTKERAVKRRWGIGLGGGGYTVQSGGGNAINTTHFLRSDVSVGEEKYYSTLNLKYNKLPKLRMKHHTPLSFGIGFGYALNERWSLQGGVTYSYLSSEWETEGKNSGDFFQSLHFLGIPFGLNYTIAEWNRFRFYLSAGGAVEWNIAGRLKSDYYEYPFDKVPFSNNEKIHMKQLQWSVNSRTGVSYPLLRYVNAFVEGVGSYYINNGSFIETYRTEKPFRLSLHTGIRLGI